MYIAIGVAAFFALMFLMANRLKDHEACQPEDKPLEDEKDNGVTLYEAWAFKNKDNPPSKEKHIKREMRLEHAEAEIQAGKRRPIFHGGCLRCTQEGLTECRTCQYLAAEWNLPDKSNYREV
jgi:hypothetical protein